MCTLHTSVPVHVQEPSTHEIRTGLQCSRLKVLIQKHICWIEVENGVSKMHAEPPKCRSCKELECWPFHCLQNSEIVWRHWYVCNIQGYRESPFKKFRTHDELAIPDVVLDKTLIYLQVQQHLLQTTGTDVCIATLCNVIAKCWIYSKKFTLRAQQRSDELGQHTQATRVFAWA